MRAPVSLLFATCTAIGCASTDDDDDFTARLTADVEAIAASGVVGVQAVATRDEASAWAAAGVAERDGAIAIGPHSRFRIASTTKTFVAIVALQLVEEGVLALDDTVDEWLPGVVAGHGNDGAAMTLRQLLQHTSGLRNHVDDQVAMLMQSSSPTELDALLARTWTPEELVALATAHAPAFAPGEGWAYTDTGYVLVGMMVEAATGTSWNESIAARIVAPLSLRDTFAPTDDPAIPGAYMHGYAVLPGSDAPRDVTAVNPSGIDAAGAVVSTPADIDTVFRALGSGELLGPELLGQMRDAIEVGDGLRYGLGLAWAPSACGGYWTHFGDTLGYHTRNAVDDDGTRSVTVALSGDGDFEAPIAALIDRVLCD